MSQAHLIVKSWKDRIAATPALSNALPGELHYGKRVDTDTPRPFGQIEVEEEDRSYHSGGAALVRYKVTLRLFVDQKVGDVGDRQAAFANAFNTSRELPSVEGQVLPIVATGATILESDEAQFGKDIMIGEQTWAVMIQETDPVFAGA